MDAEKYGHTYEHMKARGFELGARLPISWKSVSLTLKHAADRLYDLYYDATLRHVSRVLEEADKGGLIEGSRTLEGRELEDHRDGQLISAYLLLIGYAIENLLKAILMIQHPEYFKPDSKLTDIRSHDLAGLCNRCGIAVQDQATLLEKLTSYIEWQGKYPIPLVSDEMWPKRQPDGTWKTGGEAFHGRKTQQEVDSLYTRIWNELERIK